ncbi:MAG: hypothetical protein IKJ77_07835 [Firmicutes bacterium]|nr:hypothetical protein [Bacillota bacterium]
MLEHIRLSKESVTRLVVVLIVSAVVFLSLSILTDSDDGRGIISDNNGASESALCSILSEIKGAGAVNVLVEYGEEGKACGVIVTAEGADDPVVKNDIVKGVSTLYGIPASSVMVFEKKGEQKE